MADRKRSASPRRSEGDSQVYRDRQDADGKARKKSKSGGFKWKDKNDKDTASSKKGSTDRRNSTEDARAKVVAAAESHLDEEPEETTPNPPPAPAQSSIDDDIAAKFGASAAKKFASKPKTTPSSTGSSAAAQPDGPVKEKKPKREKSLAVSNEQMMLVTVNDRLGTKAQVPCLPSDTVKNFKMLVANRIGRHPHEIMIKRQGHKPFKDALTLADYEVSNGVQLDLELNTGD